MVGEALQITLFGMGGVFAFLILLICAMRILRLGVEKTAQPHAEKIAAAIALAYTQEN